MTKRILHSLQIRKPAVALAFGVLVLALAMLWPGSLHAETVSQKQASQLAQQFFNAAHGQVMGAPKMVYNGRRLTTNSLFPPFYVYNFPGGGFVVISAENKAFPILGYNLRENFDPANLNEKEKALLTSYARDIERIRYDERIPYEAIEAWNDFPGYVDSVLKSPYVATDALITSSEARQALQPVYLSDRAEYISSTYTPEQWMDAINSELKDKQNAVIGLYDYDGDYITLLVHGRKNGFYRIDLDGPNKSLYRLFATELFSDGQVAALGKTIALPDIEEPDMAFRFYDDFIKETEDERRKEQSRIENFNIISDPQIQFIGAGHFTILMPEKVDAAYVYNIGGALVERRYYPDTEIVNLDIATLPQGFYIALLRAQSGKIYGVKLLR